LPPKVDRPAAINERIDDLRDEVRAISKPPWWPLKLYAWAINQKGTSFMLSIILCAVNIVWGRYFKYWVDHKDDGFNNNVDGRIDKALKASGVYWKHLRKCGKRQMKPIQLSKPLSLLSAT
jgi:hypothetical protein